MLFNDYLKRIKTNNNFTNSLVVRTINCCDYSIIIKSYLKALNCKNENPYCNSCNICNRINQDSYIDLIYISNDEKNVTKDDIYNIQSNFSKPSSEESGIKLYVIKNIENANKQVMNSLLKFIEDSPKNTFALFFTTNINQIIPTITSRSNVISIDDVAEGLNKNNVMNEIIKDAFVDYDEYLQFCNDHNLQQINDLANLGLNINEPIDEINFAKKVSSLDKWEFSVLLNILLKKIPIKYKLNISEMLRNIKLNINMKNSALMLAQWLKDK